MRKVILAGGLIVLATVASSCGTALYTAAAYEDMDSCHSHGGQWILGVCNMPDDGFSDTYVIADEPV